MEKSESNEFTVAFLKQNSSIQWFSANFYFVQSIALCAFEKCFCFNNFFFVLHLLLLHFCIAIKVRLSSIKVGSNFISVLFLLKSSLSSTLRLRFFG